MRENTRCVRSCGRACRLCVNLNGFQLDAKFSPRRQRKLEKSSIGPGGRQVRRCQNIMANCMIKSMDGKWNSFSVDINWISGPGLCNAIITIFVKLDLWSNNTLSLHCHSVGLLCCFWQFYAKISQVEEPRVWRIRSLRR